MEHAVEPPFVGVGQHLDAEQSSEEAVLIIREQLPVDHALEDLRLAEEVNQRHREDGHLEDQPDPVGIEIEVGQRVGEDGG